MKTLYERLSDEKIEVLTKKREAHPITVGKLIDALTKETTIYDLSIRNAARLHDIFHPYTPFNLLGYYDLFYD